MEFLNNLPWQTVFYNNTLSEYVWALGLFLLIVLAFKIIKNRLWQRLKNLSKLSNDATIDFGEYALAQIAPKIVAYEAEVIIL